MRKRVKTLLLASAAAVAMGGVAGAEDLSDVDFYGYKVTNRI